MKASFYNIYFTHQDKFFIYNTLTTTIVAVDGASYDAIKDTHIDSLTNEVKNQLYQQRILVDAALDELAVFECYYNSSQYGAINDELRLVVLPTYNCNLRCTYCFEECTNHLLITDEGISQIIEFVKEQTTSNHLYKRVSVVLFGGEPLICASSCVKICNAIREICANNQLIFESKIITNATLITPEIIQSLFIPNKMRIQITLDGNKEMHDVRRKYKSGKGSYEEIMHAILLLNQFNLKDTIDLRVNVDKNNISSIEPVLADVYDKVGYIYIGLLRAEGSNKEHLSDCITDNDYVLNYRPQLEPIFNKYGKQLHYASFGKKHSCALNSGNSFIIDCSLDVYKCDNLVGRTDYSIGKIHNGKIKRNSQYYTQRSWSPLHFECCRQCNRLPACAASCAYLCLSRNGSMNIPLCAITEKQLINKLKQFIDNNARQ